MRICRIYTDPESMLTKDMKFSSATRQTKAPTNDHRFLRLNKVLVHTLIYILLLMNAKVASET